MGAEGHESQCEERVKASAEQMAPTFAPAPIKLRILTYNVCGEAQVGFLGGGGPPSFGKMRAVAKRLYPPIELEPNKQEYPHCEYAVNVRKNIIKNVKDSNADVVLMQEAMDHFVVEMENDNISNDYHIVFDTGVFPTGVEVGEAAIRRASLILLKKSMFKDPSEAGSGQLKFTDLGYMKIQSDGSPIGRDFHGVAIQREGSENVAVILCGHMPHDPVPEDAKAPKWKDHFEKKLAGKHIKGWLVGCDWNKAINFGGDPQRSFEIDDAFCSDAEFSQPEGPTLAVGGGSYSGYFSEYQQTVDYFMYTKSSITATGTARMAESTVNKPHSDHALVIGEFDFSQAIA